LCADATATFTVPFIAGAKYKWYGPDGFTSEERNPTFITTANSGGSYRLEVSVDSCKYLPSFSILVITPTPQHQKFTPPYQLCENTNLVVEVLREPAVNYLWTGKGVTQLDQDLKLPSIRLDQSGEYILTSTSDNGCVTMDTITVAVDKRATFSMVSDTAICSVDSALLPVNSDAVKIRWTPTNGLSDSTLFNVKARPAATTTYTAVASPGNTCPDTSGSATVTIIPTPSVVGYDTLVRMNIPYVIMPTFGQEVVKWTWVPGDSLSCSDCPKPTFNSNKPMTYLVYGTNAEGCVGKDTVNIRVFCDGANVTMPNAFTPNNDGNNDIYYVRGTGFTVKSFTIFNRLGQEVFRRENFTPNDPSMGWDGTFGGHRPSAMLRALYICWK
jgi:gliding motility-associated-like protein